MDELKKIDNKIQEYNEKKYMLIKNHPEVIFNNSELIEEKSKISSHYLGQENDLNVFIDYLDSLSINENDMN